MRTAAHTSASERDALAFYATLPVPVAPTQSFVPLLSSQYWDGAGVELEGRPDALATQGRSFTFIESKNGKLNFHPDKASSHRALQDEYSRTMHDAREKPYNFLTDHFYRTNPPALLDHAWNHSLFKVLAIQAEHGWQRYIVCFKRNPSRTDAKRYIEAGLVFCTEKTLMDMLPERVNEFETPGGIVRVYFLVQAAFFSVAGGLIHAAVGSLAWRGTRCLKRPGVRL